MNSIAKPFHFAAAITLFLSLLLPAPWATAQSGSRSFVIAGSSPEAAPSGLPANVIRQRQVALNLSAPDQAMTDAGRILQISFFENATYSIELQRTEATHSGGVAYAGRVAGVAFSPAVIVNNDGVVSVMLSTPDKRFSITGTPGIGYTARELVVADPEDHPDDETNVANSPFMPRNVPGLPGADAAPTAPSAARDTGATIDVMVIYTASARTANGGTAQMNANVDAQITLTNTIYANSSVVQRLRLVYKGETAYSETTLNAGLNHVTSTTDGFMDDVPTLRDLYRADLVSVWGNFSDACGLGWLMSNENTNFASLGYNTVTSPLCTGSGSFTFAHELGHNMGLNHDIVPDPGTTTTVTQAGTGTTATIAYSRGYVDTTNRFRTVMAYADGCTNIGISCLRIPHFSNPAITYDNRGFFASASATAPTGIANNDSLAANQQVANVSHEQRALDDTRETVANFRQPELSSLTGPGTLTFLVSTVSVPEAGPSVTLQVHRHIGSTGAVSVQYATANGTATAGSDYTSTSGTLNWADGDTAAKSIVVPVSQDATLEGNETFTVTLSNPGGGASLGTLSAVTVRIQDDEPDTFPAGGMMPGGFVTPGASSGAWTVDTTDGYLSTASIRSANVLAATQGIYVNSDLSYTGEFVAGNVTFAWKLSSYPSFGQFDFLIDGVVVLNNTGGEVNWTTASHAITAGNHTLTWRFKNRLNFACAVANPPPPGGSNCADRAWVDSIVLPLVPISTTTSLGTSQNPSTFGQSVTFTATVSASSGTPSGTINFRDGGASIVGCAAVVMASGSAQCTTSALPQGTRAITAVYSGSATHATSTSSTLNQTVNAPAAGGKKFDFNADSRGDILLRNAGNGQNYLYPMNGTAILPGEGFIRTVAAPWTVAGVGDFDGDGRADILWRNTTTGENYMYPMNGTAILGTEGFIRSVPTVWTVGGIGDFDGDGKADILWRNTSTGENYLYFMDGRTIKPTEGFTRSVATVWAPATIADFDGDGKADILWRHTGTGENYLYPMDGKLIKATEGFIRSVPTNWIVGGSGDFDGDGKGDLLWRNTTTGENYLYFMDGRTIKPTEGFTRSVPTVWIAASVTDFDGDGKADILWRNTSTGENYIYPMDGKVIKATEGFTRTVPTAWSVASK